MSCTLKRLEAERVRAIAAKYPKSESAAFSPQAKAAIERTLKRVEDGGLFYTTAELRAASASAE